MKTKQKKMQNQSTIQPIQEMEMESLQQKIHGRTSSEIQQIRKLRLRNNIHKVAKSLERSDNQQFNLQQMVGNENYSNNKEEEELQQKYNINSIQLRSLELNCFQKNSSESEFMNKNQMKNNQNLIQNNKIQLVVRIRPFLPSEQIKECLKVVNDTGIRLFKEYHQINFKFDNILLPNDNQDNVFQQVQKTISDFMKGINGTIFAYGQTGAGKTYSIIGNENVIKDMKISQKRGILPRSIDQIFQELTNDNFYQIWISFYEIYNEKIYDLLQLKKDKALELREEKEKGQFSIQELKKQRIYSREEAYIFMEKGIKQRQTSSTSLNNCSSRSHSIFQISLEKIDKEGQVLQSKLRIVDLAGSEKYTIKKDLPLQEKQMKVQELTSINSSLSTLGQCISALADLNRKHIPYRNSKLTKVLKDSLDDSSNVSLIVCISPSIDSYKETLSTLQFAD